MLIREQDITIAGHGAGNPSTKNMYSYLESRYSQKAPNGLRKGLVAVRRRKDLDTAKRAAFREAYRSILGRNIYSQSLREYVFKPYKGAYYSDCSSSGDACYTKAGAETPWLNTAGIYTSSLFETVPVIIEAGHVKNPEILRVGDALLFRGNDPDRPLQIGHVEYIYDTPAESSWHWVQDGAGWYYQDADGNNKKGWEIIEQTDGGGKHWYYFNSKGRAVTGVQIIDGARYYFQPDGPLECALCITDESGALVPWYV